MQIRAYLCSAYNVNDHLQRSLSTFNALVVTTMFSNKSKYLITQYSVFKSSFGSLRHSRNIDSLKAKSIMETMNLLRRALPSTLSYIARRGLFRSTLH